jgi:galactosamine-6-phosphate isomerase
MSRAAAEFLVAAVRAKPDLLLCLPAGSSPARVFELLIEARSRDPRLFARIRVIKLDEWGGLDMDDPASCEAYLQTRFLRPLGISPERYFGWRSVPPNPAEECDRVAAWLADQGPIDLCLLGIGTNGHLGLNEPGISLQPGPHVAQLTEESAGHGMLARARRRPEFGLTLGMADLLRSRQVVLLASGETKAAQMERLSWGEVFTECPASFLWLHPAVCLFADEAAMSRVPAFQ